MNSQELVAYFEGIEALLDELRVFDDDYRRKCREIVAKRMGQTLAEMRLKEIELATQKALVLYESKRTK